MNKMQGVKDKIKGRKGIVLGPWTEEESEREIQSLKLSSK